MSDHDQKQRKEANTNFNDKFSFLTDDKLTTGDIEIKNTNLVQAHPLALEKDIVEEFLIFCKLFLK